MWNDPFLYWHYSEKCNLWCSMDYTWKEGMVLPQYPSRRSNIVWVIPVLAHERWRRTAQVDCSAYICNRGCSGHITAKAPCTWWSCQSQVCIMNSFSLRHSSGINLHCVHTLLTSFFLIIISNFSVVNYYTTELLSCIRKGQRSSLVHPIHACSFACVKDCSSFQFTCLEEYFST